MRAFTYALGRRSIIRLLLIYKLIILSWHLDDVPMISTGVSLFVLITILQCLQIIYMTILPIVAASSNRMLISMNSGQFFSFRRIRLLIIHVKLAHLILWRSKILQYVLNVVRRHCCVICGLWPSTSLAVYIMWPFYANVSNVCLWANKIKIKLTWLNKIHITSTLSAYLAMRLSNHQSRMIICIRIISLVIRTIHYHLWIVLALLIIKQLSNTILI